MMRFAGAVAILTLAASAQAERPMKFFAQHEGVPRPASVLHTTPEQQAAAIRVPNPHRAGPNFTVIFNDVVNNTNIGFDDPAEGATRRAALLAVFSYLQTVIANTGDCEVLVNDSQTDGTGALAFAGTSYFLIDGFYEGIAAEHIITGTDPAAGSDIGCTVDFGYAWHADHTTAPPGGEFDLFTVMLHEVTHGLGIASLAAPTGLSQFDPDKTFTKWDDNLFDTSNTKVWNSATQAFQLGAGGLDQGDNTINFSGANATTALGTEPFIYTPASFASGSSVSHWQFTSPTPSTAVMRHAVSPGVANRSYQPFEIEALRDLGYSIASANIRDWDLY